MKSINKHTWEKLSAELNAKQVRLVAVSKKQPVAAIQELYNFGQRDFGENYVQELTEKQPQLPNDIRWHFIGHLQGNKVKYIAPFVHLIHTVDSFKLLAEINKQAEKNNRTIDVLLQVYIAREDTKFGMDETELNALLDQFNAQKDTLKNVRICGLMGMASNTDNKQQVRAEFARLNTIFNSLKTIYFSNADWFSIRSMGMSGDYRMAIEEGSDMVRIGSMLFGER